MVAPLVIAGIGLGLGALGAGAAKVFGKAELFAVVWLRRRKHKGPREGGSRRSMSEVEPFLIAPGQHGGMNRGAVSRMQDETLEVEHHRNHAPDVTEVVGKTFDSLDKAKAFQDDLANKHYTSSIIVHQAEGGELDSLNPIRAAQPPAKKMGAFTSSHPTFDTRAEGMNVLNISTDHPTPEWAVQARQGPYPARETPYDDTFSSHMYDVAVPELVVPKKYFPGTDYRFGEES